jgi:hypothetical protein
MNRWSQNGVLDRVFEPLQREQIVRIKLQAVSMDSKGQARLWPVGGVSWEIAA